MPRTSTDASSDDPEHAPRRRREKKKLLAAAVRSLMELRQRSDMTSADVKTVARTLGVHERTVWRRLEKAQALGTADLPERPRFTITEEIRIKLAYHHGNIKAVHLEMLDEAADARDVPSLSTLHRTVKRDLPPGDLAGLREGIPASRAHDPHLRRPPTCRNEEWEGDHKQVPILVWADGRLVKPWVTWFCDCHTGMTMGWAVTPHYPHRASILAALRACILTDEVHGPAGGLPRRIRIDRGRDFLSRAVTEAMGCFSVQVDVLPPYTPHRKGSIENLNRAATSMFFSTLPRYTKAQKLDTKRRVGDKDPALSFEAFVDLFAKWVRTRNAEHRMQGYGDVTPLESWLSDDTPLREPPLEDLHVFLLEEERSTRIIHGHGIRWQNRDYVGAWMTGRTGTQVRIRYQPHHPRAIEVFDAHTDQHLGTAHLADEASEDEIRAVYEARDERVRRLRRDLADAKRRRRRRFQAVTQAEPARTAGTMTRAQAAAELASTRRSRAKDDGVPAGYMPRRVTPGARWAMPAPASTEENSTAR
ncbi:Mu transposase C-terminal domain-containing protein [Streptomyces sp. Rer75]|uniref:Mu transposase C-terminal domain-containing protein n=1 Tax=Streptomyces sp. Rer75 TaxID=2750011 RepID=UPI0015CFDDAD|nr:Mu transposase C-terminal domain-containing protein [Streptomyces sp. Rer75]QLH19378.1 Mu transposase C-terminal domain-containing protein [Streptomyces sp. Rer75]